MTLVVHADPLDMVTYVRGCLSEERAEEVRKHCFACRDCGDQLAAIILLRGAAPLRSSVPWYARRSIAAAAAAVIVLVGAAAWVAGRGAAPATRGPIDVEAIVAASPDGASGSPTGVRVFTEITLADIGIIEKVADLGSMIVGAENPATNVNVGAAEVITALQAGVRALADGEYGDAARALGGFASSYHPLGTPLLGLALFFDGSDLPAARQALEAHVTVLDDLELTDSSNGHAAAYYLARLYLQAGHDHTARELLRRIVPDPGSDPDRLQEAVKQLLLELH